LFYVANVYPVFLVEACVTGDRSVTLYENILVFWSRSGTQT